jgi:hypothetical protein
MARSFDRYELKYIISIEKAKRIMSELDQVTQPDEHCLNGAYRVDSLYYDSPDLSCFWDKVDGIRLRRKLRIRVYPVAGECVREAVVEIKQRINKRVQKRRIRLPLPEAEDLCDGPHGPANLNEQDQQVAAEVEYMVRTMQLRPSCMTSYLRRAFIGGRYDTGLRMTFDTDLRCRVCMLKAGEDAINRLFAPPDKCIMEVKVDESVPGWVTGLLSRHDCHLQRISKYCSGLVSARGFAMLPLVAWSAETEKTNELHG